MRRALARLRWASLGVVWDAADPEPKAIAAPPSAPQFSLTVIHVEAGAYLNVGGLIFDPRAITPAFPQQRAAIPEGTGEQE